MWHLEKCVCANCCCALTTEVKTDDDKVNGTDVDAVASIEGASSTGISDFWLTAFKNCEIFADIIKVIRCIPSSLMH